jgi:dihydrofolate reductase
MNRFKKITIHHHVLMGRKTFLSIPEKFRPLPDRTNIVVSSSEKGFGDGVLVFDNLDNAIKHAFEAQETELMVIGGGQIYEQTITKADRLYVTRVMSSFKADTFFSKDFETTFHLVDLESFQANEKNAFDMQFEVWEKV